VYGACSFEQSIFDETNDQWRGRHRVLKEDILSTACELTTLILSRSVSFNVTCLNVTSLITKSNSNHASNVGQYILVHFTRLCTSRFEVWW